MIRRALLGVAAVALALLPLDRALADEAPQPADAVPSGWTITVTAPADSDATSTDFSGTATNNGAFPVTITLKMLSGPGSCGSVTTEPATGSSTNRAMDAHLVASCNGRYVVQVLGRRTNLLGQTEQAYRNKTIKVAVPPPAVGGLTATTNADRTVTVAWDAVDDPSPDFMGYRLERCGDPCAFEPIFTGTDTSFIDAGLPAGGGSFVYRVYGLRKGPDGSVTSSTAPAAGATLAAPATGGTDSGGTDTGSTTPGGGGTGTTGPGGGGAGSGSSTTAHPRHTNRVVIRAPRVGTPSNAFFPPLLTPPKATDVDTGFDETLPYDPETGEQAAELPGDGLASSPLDGGPGRGLAIPVAMALVLAVWAFHLRYLARASRPVYLDEPLEPYTD